MLRFVLALVAFSGTVCAQSGEPGYVVVQGDTLRAEVEIGTEFDASRGLRYRTASGEWEQADPPAVEAFGTDAGRRYRRRLLLLSLDRPEDSSTPLERLAFARVVRDGPAALLALEVTLSRPLFFVEVEDGGPIGLYRVQEQILRGNGLRRQRDVALYRQALATTLAGCDIDVARFESLPYTEDALAGVVDDYNRCQGGAYRQPVVAVAQRRPSELALEIGLGLASGTFQRLNTGAFSFDDPNQSSTQLRAVLEWSPSELPSAFTLLAGLEYDRALIRHVDSQVSVGRVEARRDGILLSLGGRLTLDVVGTPVFAGVHVLGGKLISGSRNPLPNQEPASGEYISNITPSFLNSAGGTVIEAGLRPLGGRVGIGVQYRWVGFSGSGFYIPGNPNRSNRYSLEGAAIMVSGRL